VPARKAVLALRTIARRAAASLLVTADENGRVPALLLEWRETPDRWQERVVRPGLDREDGKWRPREEWLPATLLEQA
jgi:hypothetical protein